MLETIIRQCGFNLAYAQKLVEDLSEEQMTLRPFPGFENHPAFTLGHLVTAIALTIEDLGGKPEWPKGWDELFLRKGPGDPTLPAGDASLYPNKVTLLNELEKQHQALTQLLRTTDATRLDQPIKWRFSTFMPSLLDVVTFMCINHTAMHLGQLAAWRRAMGLPTALGKM